MPRPGRQACFLTGATQQVFASAQNIYLASPAPVDPLPLLQKYLGQLTPLLPDSLTNQLTDPGASQEQKLQHLAEVLSMGNSTGPGNQAEIAQIVSAMQQDVAAGRGPDPGAEIPDQRL